MRRLLWVPLVLLAASAMPSLLPAQARMMVIRTVSRRSDRIIADTMGTPLDVPFPAQQVFGAVAAVFDEWRIPIELRDSTTLEVGNVGFLRRGSVGGRRMSSILECGGGLSGPYADSHRIDLSLVTFINPTAADASAIRTILLGAAVNVGEGARPTQMCYSLGELERRLHQLVLQRLRR